MAANGTPTPPSGQAAPCHFAPHPVAGDFAGDPKQDAGGGNDIRRVAIPILAHGVWARPCLCSMGRRDPECSDGYLPEPINV